MGEFQWHQWENVLAAARWLCIGRQQETRWRPSQWTLIRNGCQWSRSSPDITSQVTSNTVQRVKRRQNCQRWSKQIIKLYYTGHDINNLVMQLYTSIVHWRMSTLLLKIHWSLQDYCSILWLYIILYIIYSPEPVINIRDSTSYYSVATFIIQARQRDN